MGAFQDRLQGLARKILPTFARRWIYGAMVRLSVRRNFRHDRKRFLKWSGAKNAMASRASARAVITAWYHAIEKALSLEAPRVNFGLQVRERLLCALEQYLNKYGADDTTDAALKAMTAYCEFNANHDNPVPEIERRIQRLREHPNQSEERTILGGVRETSREEIQEMAMMDLRPFFMNRYSIRQFSPKPVDSQLIRNAVDLARKTPSVCNRQGWKVYAFSNKETIKNILAFQRGSRGFSEQVDKLLIVTSNLEHFLSVGERYQCWIDGGMFSMSLIYALHSLGLGTCPLNCSLTGKREKTLRKLAGIPEPDSVVLMIAVGNLAERFSVAHSQRKDIAEILVSDVS